MRTNPWFLCLYFNVYLNMCWNKTFSSDISIPTVYVKKYLFYHHLGRKEKHFGLATKTIEVSSSYFSISVSIGKIFQLFGKLFQFENCLHSLVCFGAKRESSVTCAWEPYRVILTSLQWDYGPEKIKMILDFSINLNK